MAFDTALLELMTSTIRVSTRTAHDNYGKPTFTGSTTSYRARIVRKMGYVRNAEGEEVGFNTVAWIRSTGATSITVSDRITLPSGAAHSTRPEVLAVERYPDEDGQHHVKAYFGH